MLGWRGGECHFPVELGCWALILERWDALMVSINRLFPIRAIGQGICLLERDRFTAVFEAIPVNFALKGLSEQERLVQGYVTFLNGLTFPLEVLVRADTLRMDEYLAELKARENEIDAHLRPSLGEYIEFIRESASVRHLIRRRFYVLLSWRGTDSRSRPLRKGEILWEEAERELAKRKELVEQGLARLGVRLRTLDAEETFQLIYAGLGGGQALSKGVNWIWD